MIKLYAAIDIAKELGITKQAVHLAEREGRIESPEYKIGNFKGWTKQQVERIKEKMGK